MRICDASVPGPAQLSTGRTSLVPFLPTLATAFAIGGLSLLCREPVAPIPIAPAPSMTMVVETIAPVAPPTRDARDWPASLLLAQLPPPAMTEPAPAPVRVANRRICAAGRCETRRALAARSAPATSPARPSPEPVLARRDAPEPERTGTLPDDALPFLPAVDRVWDAARTLGSRVVAIGSSVSGGLPDLH